MEVTRKSVRLARGGHAGLSPSGRTVAVANPFTVPGSPRRRLSTEAASRTRPSRWRSTRSKGWQPCRTAHSTSSAHSSTSSQRQTISPKTRRRAWSRPSSIDPWRSPASTSSRMAWLQRLGAVRVSPDQAEAVEPVQVDLAAEALAVDQPGLVGMRSKKPLEGPKRMSRASSRLSSRRSRSRPFGRGRIREEKQVSRPWARLCGPRCLLRPRLDSSDRGPPGPEPDGHSPISSTPRAGRRRLRPRGRRRSAAGSRRGSTAGDSAAGGRRRCGVRLSGVPAMSTAIRCSP